MSYDELVQKIIDALGGKENLVSAVHCMTRLRITLRRDDAVDLQALRNAEGILAVHHSLPGYIEVVVGPGASSKCAEIFRAMGVPASVHRETPSVAPRPETSAPRKKGAAILKTFGQIFAPLIPGIVAAGICAGLAAIIAQAVPDYDSLPFWSVAHSLLSGINAALITYLTAWAGYRTAEVFGGTPILGGMVGMISTLDLINTVSQKIGLYNDDQPLQSILRAGRGGVLAALAGVWLMCRLEKAIRKRMPNALDTVFTPLLTLLGTLIPYVFVLMPVLGLVSSWLCSLVELVAMNASPLVRMLAGFISAALFLPMVAAGMHHGLIALYTVQLDTLGYVTLYPALAMAGAGQVGAAIALALLAKKTGNSRLRRVIHGALPAAVLGVGEPLIYGVTLPLGKPFLTAGLGAGFGGAFVMLMEVAATTWGPSGLLGCFVMTEGPRGAGVSVACYAVGLLISGVAAFFITRLFVKADDVAHT